MAFSVVGTSGWVADSTFIAPTLTIPLPARKVDDLVLIFSWTISLTDPTVPTAIEAPTGYTTLDSDLTAYQSREVFAGWVDNASLSNVVIPRGTGHPGSYIWLAFAVLVRHVSRETTFYEDFLVTAINTASPSVPALNVAGNNRRVLHMVIAHVGGRVPGSIIGLEDWTKANPSSIGIDQGAAFKAFFPNRVASADTLVEDFTISNVSETWDGYIVSFVFKPRPLAAVSYSAEPQPQRLSLRCAETYQAFLTDATYRNTIDRIGWTQMTWSKVLDEVSTATCTVPDETGGVYCCASNGGLVPWDYGLLIERNDSPVWCGPITTLNRERGAIRISASDVLSRYGKRVVIRDEDYEYKRVDVGTIFSDIINTHAFDANDPWTLPAPTFIVDAALTKSLIPRRFEYALPVLQELLDSAVDAYVDMGVLYCWDPAQGWVYYARNRTRVLEGPYNSNLDFVYGLFTEDAFSELPLWSISGASQANTMIVPGTDSGELGFRRYWSAEDLSSRARIGSLDMVDPNPLYRADDDDPEASDAVYQQRADRGLALRTIAPAVISGGTLREGAPVDIDNLRPGSLWRLDIFDNCYGQLLQAGRLKRIDVTVSATDTGVFTEQIEPTLLPIGFAGGEE